MKKIIFILSLFTIVSCQFFEQKKAPNEDELLQQRLKEVNWKTVDQLPTVANCDSLTDKNEQKKCFFEFLTTTINQKINIDTLSKFYPKKDFLLVKISVFPNEPLHFESVIKDSLEVDKHKIDSILNAKLTNLPVINPAIKRGIPVKSQFAIRIELTK